MYTLAVIAMLALATVKLVDFLCDTVPGLANLRSVLTFVCAIGAALALDYSMFSAWGVEISNATMAKVMTGLCIAGTTVMWRAVFSYLTHDRATRDESLGEHTPLRRAA